MRRVRGLATCCLAIGLLRGAEETGDGCKNLSYENRNQADYGPLHVAAVRGVAKDAQGIVIPKTCIGIFTEEGHKLVATTQTDNKGRFDLNDIPDGAYRLIAKYDGFSTANAKLRIEPRSHSKKSLTVQMRLSGLDAHSFIELK